MQLLLLPCFRLFEAAIQRRGGAWLDSRGREL
jgi:hypothetical protein